MSEITAATVQHIWASRYLSIAGVVVLFYDHLLTLDREVELIWLAPWKTPKTLYLFLRYLVHTTLIIHAYQLSGLGNDGLTDKFCQIWFPLGLVLGVISLAVGNFLVLIHVWNLWERKRLFILWSLLLFIATQLANIVCLVMTVRDLVPHVAFSKDLKLCVLIERGIIALLWAPGLFFEAIMFFVVLWNAFNRPRTVNSDVARALCRDGLIYFASLFTLRLANLLLFSFATLSLIFLGVFFIWCSTTMTVTRLVLNLRRMHVKNELKRRLGDQDSTLCGLNHEDLDGNCDYFSSDDYQWQQQRSECHGGIRPNSCIGNDSALACGVPMRTLVPGAGSKTTGPMPDHQNRHRSRRENHQHHHQLSRTHPSLNSSSLYHDSTSSDTSKCDSLDER
ncbi:hypothetical protein K435DRAFT_775393 [Dendrothele bispora CBS 962.96]|uniref:DUF6533 domain-containing protein n=1 Tax=Dendrothele bispora (strain CBS 962.96) TaxID=1314807 RepID=A0A4S8MJJ4_DENBC|nr:hypothetical protein K435DRAFT_775393 [Dendrothele bispora CBS 962.96]